MTRQILVVGLVTLILVLTVLVRLLATTSMSSFMALGLLSAVFVLVGGGLFWLKMSSRD